MKHLKEYKLWEQSRELASEQEEFLNQYVKGSWRINSEGLVDVEGDFNCSSKKIVSLNGIRFGAVSGNFYCYRNQLTSLEGAPREVGGNFDCSENHLTSLKGAPQEVVGNFNCSVNQLISLEGAPREVGGNYYFSENPISDQTMELICREMREHPEMEYGAILAYLQSRIPQEDWEKLDKSSLYKMNQSRKRVYGMLGGIGGI